MSLRTAALTFFCSASEPSCATRTSALRARALSGIGYVRLPGRAKDLLLSFAPLRAQRLGHAPTTAVSARSHGRKDGRTG
jgi:hypothetical protein